MNANSQPVPPACDTLRSSNRPTHLISLRVASVILAVTAFLKYLIFLETPISLSRLDPVIAGVTAREALLIAAVVESVLAIYLLNCSRPLRGALLLIQFCTCAALYHVVLLLTGTSSECQCLGVIAQSMSPGFSIWTTRLLLLALTSIGFHALYSRRRTWRHESNAERVTQLSALFLIFSVWHAAVPVRGDTVAFHGEYSYTPPSGAQIPPRRFKATYSDTSLVIEALLPTNRPFGNTDRCTNVTLINQSNIITSIRCQGRPVIGIGFDSAAPAWQLGSCGDTMISTVFLAMYCSDLMPTTEETGQRPMASTMSGRGEPLSLISIANWNWHLRGQQVSTLDYAVIVDAARYTNWLNSPFLPPAYPKGQAQQDRYILSGFAPGSTIERLHFSNFLYVGTNPIALAVDGVQTFYSPTRTAGVYKTNTYTSRLRMAVVGPSDTNRNSFEFFPVQEDGLEIHVAENRLVDTNLHVAGARFKTNRLSSAEISEAAQADFEARKAEAQRRIRIMRIKRIATWCMVLVALAFPLIYYFLHRYMRKKGVTDKQ